MVSKRLPVPPNLMLLSPAPTSPPEPFLHTFSDLTERLLEPFHMPECEQCEQGWACVAGVTGQNIPQAGLYPGLKRPRLDYTRVYYGLGQFIPRVYYGLGLFIPPQAKIYPHDINHDINSVERYTHDLFNFSASY